MARAPLIHTDKHTNKRKNQTPWIVWVFFQMHISQVVNELFKAAWLEVYKRRATDDNDDGDGDATLCESWLLL